MYPQEFLSLGEQEIVFRIRQLIGDELEVFVDEVSSDACSTISAGGTLYQLEEPKGYPLMVTVDGVEYTTSGTNSVAVVGYKYLQFNQPTLVSGATLVAMYNHFRHSDTEILNVYDTSALTYLTKQCNLTIEELGVDLLTLSTSYVLLTKDLNNYIKSAVEIQDGESRFSAINRPRYLLDLMKQISDELKQALSEKTKCKMLSLPVYKVE